MDDIILLSFFYFHVSFLMLLPWIDDKITAEARGQSGHLLFLKNNSASGFFFPFISSGGFGLNARCSVPNL